jgi:hypothetical protein
LLSGFLPVGKPPVGFLLNQKRTNGSILEGKSKMFRRENVEGT